VLRIIPVEHGANQTDNSCFDPSFPSGDWGVSRTLVLVLFWSSHGWWEASQWPFKSFASDSFFGMLVTQNLSNILVARFLDQSWVVVESLSVHQSKWADRGCCVRLCWSADLITYFWPSHWQKPRLLNLGCYSVVLTPWSGRQPRFNDLYRLRGSYTNNHEGQLWLPHGRCDHELKRQTRLSNSEWVQASSRLSLISQWIKFSFLKLLFHLNLCCPY
jgi:hypothetical protein